MNFIEFTAVQIVSACGPRTQFISALNVTRSGDGKQIGFTQRLNRSGVCNFNSDKSLDISVQKKYFYSDNSSKVFI